MRPFVLDTNSTILCPHGGTVVHVPTAYSNYKVSGLPPMRQADTYIVTGCPFMGPGGMPMPCMRVEWATASTNLIVCGSPVLLQTSSGICIGPAVTGPAMVVSHQMVVREPDNITVVN